MEFDTKAFLRHHSPELFEVISETRIDWNRLGKNYKDRYERLLAKHEAEGIAQYESSIFEILMYASEGRHDAIYIQSFFKGTIKKLKTILSEQELKFVGDNIVGVITNLDMKYLNFIGELAVLVILKEHAKWTLTGTEIKNDVEKRIDFEFKSDKDRKVKIEIMNIHLTREISENDEGIKRFLTKRIEDKKAIKTNNHSTQVDFIIAPIIWGPVSELKKISNHLKRTPWTIQMTFKPIAFMNFTDKDENMFQKFKDLETIFD
jgi:hypothetical protein